MELGFFFLFRVVPPPRHRRAGRKKVADVVFKVGRTIDWEGLAKLLVSDDARRSQGVRYPSRASADVDHQLQTKFSQIPAVGNMNKPALPLENVSGSAKQAVKKESLVKLLRWHFGHSDFRGKQLPAIQAVLSGTDCFCLMPTGGGKLICYQIPALAKHGIALVVSPLIGKSSSSI